jgi:hypothetical protein
MEVSLSRKSWHARYYNFVKGHYPTYDFKSLCPYFWTMLSFILLSPLIVIWKGLKLVLVRPVVKVIEYRIDKSLSKPYKEPSKLSKWYEKNDSSIGKWVGRLYFGIMGTIMLLALGGAIVKLFQDKGVWMGIIYIFAWIGGLTTFVFSLWGLLKFFETDTWTMIRGMSYSVKNKVCPMITWEEDKK